MLFFLLVVLLRRPYLRGYRHTCRAPKRLKTARQQISLCVEAGMILTNNNRSVLLTTSENLSPLLKWLQVWRPVTAFVSWTVTGSYVGIARWLKLCIASVSSFAFFSFLLQYWSYTPPHAARFFHLLFALFRLLFLCFCACMFDCTLVLLSNRANARMNFNSALENNTRWYGYGQGVLQWKYIGKPERHCWRWIQRVCMADRVLIITIMHPSNE